MSRGAYRLSGQTHRLSGDSDRMFQQCADRLSNGRRCHTMRHAADSLRGGHGDGVSVGSGSYTMPHATDVVSSGGGTHHLSGGADGMFHAGSGNALSDPTHGLPGQTRPYSVSGASD